MTYQLHGNRITEVPKPPSQQHIFDAMEKADRIRDLERVASYKRPGYYAACGLGILAAGALVSCWWYVVWGMFVADLGPHIAATVSSTILTFPGIYLVNILVKDDRKIVTARRELAQLRGPAEQVQGALSVCEGAQSAQGALSTTEPAPDALVELHDTLDKLDEALSTPQKDSPE
jgi:hypothetical protein